MKYSRMLSRSLSSVWAVLRCNKGCGKSARLANAFLILLLLSAILPTRPAFAQDTQPTYTFPECEQVEENLLLGELEDIAFSVLEKEKSGLDVAKIVEDNWRDLNLDAVVDAAVDDAVEQVREDEGTWDRIFSGWSENEAEKFATKVANYAFDSTKFRDAVDRLSSAIADDLEIEIHVMTVKSASSALQCVQEFIGVTFSETMSVVLEGNIRDRLAEVDSDPDVWEGPNDPLKERTGSLAGVGTILGTQIAHLLAKNVAKGILGTVVSRILGKAASAVVPVAGWIIGVVLIIYDLYQAWEGSLPQIREDFKGEEVKQELRKQIAIEVEEELNNALLALSTSVAGGIFGQWEDFLQDFEHVLRLAENNSRFRTIIDGATANQVEKLTELVAIGDEALGAEWLARIIDTGDFERILALPKASFEILREEADPGLVLKWADLAGEAIVRVVQTELYRVATPSDFGEREILERVLALEDTIVIAELMRLSEAGRAALLRLPSAQTKWVLTELSAEEVDWLATYLSGLPTQAQGGLIDFVMRDRGLIPKLQGSEELGAKFSGVLTLAEANPTFQTILNETSADQVDKLSELVAVASEALEPEQLSDMIDAGLFEQILALPQAAFVILREKEDPALVIAWAGLPGGAIVQVVEMGLFRVASPSEFKGEETLARVLALQNHQAVRKLMLLDRGERDVLMELPVEQARPVLVALSTEDLSWLAGYFAELTRRETVLIAAYILEEPGLLPKLIVSTNLGAKFPGVLTLADQNQSFKEILGRVGVDGVEKLSDLVAVAVESLTPDQSRSLLIALSAEDLGWLAAYLPELSPLTPKLLVDYLVREPTLISQLRESEDLSAEFPRVLNLAVMNPNFREILDSTSVDEVGKLSDLVIVADETLGPEQLTAMIESGQFKSIFELPKLAFEILRVGKDPAEVVAWDELADEAIVDVVETGLYHVASPEDFKGKEELDPVLAFREIEAMVKLMGLKQVERDVLLKLETEKARALLFADMWLIVYLPELSTQALEVLVAHVPTILPELMTEIGRQSLLESQNKEVVLNFLAERAKESKPVLPTIPMLAAAVDTIAGDLPGELYWRYYSIPSLILLSLVVVLIILALSGWWLFPRRQQATGEPTARRRKRG